MNTIADAIEAAARCLAGVGIENPQRESEFLVAACLQWQRTHLTCGACKLCRSIKSGFSRMAAGTGETETPGVCDGRTAFSRSCRSK